MRKIFSLIIIFALTVLFTACLDKKEEPIEKTKDNNTTEETSDNSSNTASGNEGETGKTDGIKDLKFGTNLIPSGFDKYKGSPVAVAEWEDANGENLIIISETKVNEKEGQNGTELSKELYGYHFIMDGSDGEELWKIQDFVKDCEFDLTLSYIPESLTVTDLDNNGIAESTFMYNLSCKSDVSPDDLKLMMHEGKNKYALRGYTLLTGIGGDYKVDKAFDDAPESFLDYAKKQWEKFKSFEY